MARARVILSVAVALLANPAEHRARLAHGICAPSSGAFIRASFLTTTSLIVASSLEDLSSVRVL
jgi:hypothetical protein